MNTTKTLEAVKKEARSENSVLNQLVREGVGSPGCARVLEKTDEFAEKVWNLALDACRDAIPEQWPREQTFDPKVRGFENGYNDCREETLRAIDSLKDPQG